MVNAAESNVRRYRFDDVIVDRGRFHVEKGGQTKTLTPRAFDLLAYLLEHRDRVVEKQELFERVWRGEFVTDNALTRAIKEIRQAIGDEADSPRYIETVHKRGYRFIYPVDGLRDRLLGGVASGQITSIAVLPLENMMGDTEQDYFVEGMHEALITELSKIGALKVISRTSAMRYRNTDKSVPEIARELGVDAVIAGSVLRAGNQVRITAQLIEAATDRHLWAESYERDLQDVLVLQSEVARAIAGEIKVAVTPEETKRLASARPVNPEALGAYLKGRFYWNKRTRDGFKKGIDYFQQAVEKDQGYALAYAGLADSYALLGSAMYGAVPPREAMPKAKAAARKALELDESLANAHAALGYASMMVWDWSVAEKEFERALQLNPGYATAHQWFSIFLSLVGWHEEGVGEAKRAQELDPLSPIISAGLGLRYYFARQQEEAVQQLRKTLELEPNFGVAHEYLGRVYIQEGMYREAVAELQIAQGLIAGNPIPLAGLGAAWALSGNRGKALGILEELNSLRKRRHVPLVLDAWVHLGLGDKDKALLWLERAYEAGEAWVAFFKLDPQLDPVRSDPRFQSLLRRMKFPSR